MDPMSRPVSPSLLSALSPSDGFSELLIPTPTPLNAWLGDSTTHAEGNEHEQQLLDMFKSWSVSKNRT
jgi:hypothetical protein